MTVELFNALTQTLRLTAVSDRLHTVHQTNDSDLSLGYKKTHTHTHTFNGPFSGTTQVSRYKKCKTNLDFTEARDSEWQWHQLGHMQVCTSLKTDNTHPTPKFFTGRMPFLPPNQQRQSTEGTTKKPNHCKTQSDITAWSQITRWSSLVLVIKPASHLVSDQTTVMHTDRQLTPFPKAETHNHLTTLFPGLPR